MSKTTKKLDSWLSKFAKRGYPKGTIILSPGQIIKDIFYIKKGIIQAYSIDQRGNVLVIHTFKAGAFIPLVWAITDNPAPYYFETVSESLLLPIPQKELISFLKNDQEILFDFTKRLALGLTGLAGRLESLAMDSASERLLNLLDYLGRSFGQLRDNGDVQITLPLTHKQLASWIGSARETVSIEMKVLARKGLIKKSKGKIYLSPKVSFKPMLS